MVVGGGPAAGGGGYFHSIPHSLDGARPPEPKRELSANTTVPTAFLTAATSATMLALVTAAAQSQSPAVTWPPAVNPQATVQDLHREYGNIFRHGNRNAASHLWAAFLLDRAHMMTPERLELMFSGFCAVSGSPVRPSDYTRYRLTLPLVAGGNRSGYMYYCCAPPTPPPTAACSC